MISIQICFRIHWRLFCSYSCMRYDVDIFVSWYFCPLLVYPRSPPDPHILHTELELYCFILRELYPLSSVDKTITFVFLQFLFHFLVCKMNMLTIFVSINIEAMETISAKYFLFTCKITIDSAKVFYPTIVLRLLIFYEQQLYVYFSRFFGDF